ncbi:hypothetical protein GCM10027416_05410 [Okibacterium endophyticum]
MRADVRFVVVADSDSYVKWGAALASRTPAHWTTSLLVVETPVLPSEKQLADALAGSDLTPERVAVVSLDEAARRIGEQRPDVVLISVRGPLVRVVVRAIAKLDIPRPVLISGLPGITIPAARKAIAYRSQTDVIVLHSRREIRDFSALAADMGIEQRFGLARLPFIASTDDRPSVGDDVIFAAQAKVPKPRADRLALLGWLAELARRQPERRVVIKVRAAQGEQQTHAEEYFYADLIGELQPPPPPNLVVEGGPMLEHLVRANALVTVSSTAVIEAIARSMPTIVLDDFGIRRGLINTVFIGSGLFGNSDDLVNGRFRHPDPDWVQDNYLHNDAGEDDWMFVTDGLLARRAVEALPLKPQATGRLGSGLRRAWDRKSILGPYDTSLSGTIAVMIGTPARWAVRRMRRARARIRRRVGTRNGGVVSSAVDAVPLTVNEGTPHRLD